MGQNTLLVTLPQKWVKQQGIQKGDELEVEITGNGLTVLTEKRRGLGQVGIDISELNEQATRWVLGGLFKKGFEEIHIRLNSPKQLIWIRKLLDEGLFGFVLIDSDRETCMLRNVAQAIESELDTLLRRSFLTVQNLGEEIVRLIEDKQMQELPNALVYERLNNQLTNFCQRLLNRKGVSGSESHFLYLILWHLESICDRQKYILQHLLKHQEVSKKTLNFYKKANRFFAEYVKVFYHFNLPRLSGILEEKNSLLKEGEDLFMNLKGAEKTTIRHLLEFIEMTSCLSASITALHYKPELSKMSMPSRI